MDENVDTAPLQLAPKSRGAGGASSRRRVSPGRVEESGSGAGEDARPLLQSSIETMLESWRLVLALVLVGLVLGGAYYLLRPPIYQTDALVQVEEKQKGIPGLED